MWYNNYIGIPYKDNGRDYTGVDCWGLVRLIYEQEYGIKLPSFDTLYIGASDIEATSELIAINKENWKQTQQKIVGSVVLFTILGRQTHVGIYIGNNKFIHARQGHASVIESLNSTQWSKRIAGFFEYTESNNTIITAVPSALRTQRYVEALSEGSTLKTVLEQLYEKYKISNQLKTKTVVFLNGKFPDSDDFSRPLTKFDKIDFRAVPEGSNGLRTILAVAVMFIAASTGQFYLNSLAAESAAAAEVFVATAGMKATAFAISAAVNMAGMALINAIAPIRPPSQNNNNPGSPVALNLFTGGSNRQTPYGPLPVVLGRHRVTPPLTAANFLQPDDFTSYLSMNLCWGVGGVQLDESSLMVGGVALNEYIAQGHEPEYVTLDQALTPTTASDLTRFKNIFSTDIVQEFPNQELAADNIVGVPGPWKEVILDDESLEPENKVNKFTVTLNFPEGLRKVYTGGNSAGESTDSTAIFAIEYARRIPGTGSYEAYSNTGTSTNTSEIPSTKTVNVEFTQRVAFAEDFIPEVGRWTRIGIRRNSLVVIKGALTDSLTDKYNNSQSTTLLSALQGNAYSYLLGANNSLDVYPEFLSTPEDRVIPLASVWTTTTGVYETVDESTNSTYTKSGMQISFSDTYIPVPSTDFGEVSYRAIQVQITTGAIWITGSNVNVISLTYNRKDAFNYTTKPIVLDPPGDYKVRVRRVNLAETEVSGNGVPIAVLSNPYHVIPNTGSLNYSGTSIIVREDDSYLQFTTNTSLQKGQWRIVNAPVGTNCTPSSIFEPNSDSSVLTYLDLTAVASGFTTGSVTYNIEAVSKNGTTYLFNLIQNISKSSAFPGIFSIDSDMYAIEPKTGTSFNVNFYRSRPDDSYATKKPIPSGYYFTITESSFAEATTATALGNASMSVWFNKEGGISTTYGIISNPTFSPGLTYTYTIRLYDSANKTNLLDKCELKYLHSVSQSDPYRNFSKAILYVVTGYTNQEVFIPPKYLRGNTLVDCPITRTAIKFQSSAKVNGQVDGVNGIVSSVGFNWYPTSPSNLLTGTWKYEQTNNPASLYLYVLMHPANAYRVNATNQTELAQLVDIDAIKEWHYYCEQNNFTFNTVLDNVSSIMDVLRDICAAGRGSPLLKDGKWSVVVDKEKSEVIQHFTPYNSWGFESTRAIPRLPDAFRCVIRDEENGYQNREIVVYNLNKNSTNAEIFEEISLPGITNEATAVKHIRWNLAQLNHRPERYTINTDLEYLVCNRGDRVKVAHDVPLWGTASGRIKTVVLNGSQRTITLDDPVLLKTGISYVIRVRLDTGLAELGILQVAETKYYDTLIYTKTSSNSINPADGNLFLIGETDTAINDLVVLSIETLDNKSARLVLTDYSPSIFTENHSVLYSNISTSIVAKPPEGLTHSIVAAPKAVEFYSGEQGTSIVSSSLVSYNILANIQHVDSLPSTITGVEIEYTISGNSFDTSLNLSRKRFSLNETIKLPDVEVGKSYDIRLRYYDLTNNRVGPWMLNGNLDYFTHLVQANLIYSDIADSVDVDLDRATLLITISRAAPVPSNFSHYEVRVLKDPDSNYVGDFWDIGDNISDPRYQDLIKATTVNGQLNISLLNFQKPRLDPDGITYRIACRSVDTNNNKSKMSLIRSFLLTPLI